MILPQVYCNFNFLEETKSDMLSTIDTNSKWLFQDIYATIFFTGIFGITLFIAAAISTWLLSSKVDIIAHSKKQIIQKCIWGMLFFAIPSFVGALKMIGRAF